MSAEQWVMVVEGTALEWFPVPMYLAEFDVDVPDPYYGWGAVRLTDNLDEALVFDSLQSLMATWKTQSKTMPFRPRDGKPNRPLTRYSVQPMTIEQARSGVDVFKNVREQQ